MTLHLSIMARNEADMLARTLPAYAHHFPSRFAFVTFDIAQPTNDPTFDTFLAHNFLIGGFQWRNDFSYARNKMLEVVTHCVCPNDWLLQLDADEAMFATDIDALRDICTYATEDVIALPRINLADNARLQCTDNAPDWQARCVRIGSPARWSLPVHEVITAPHYRCYSATLYHYGWCKPPRENWLRSHNYERLTRGEAPLLAAPADIPNNYPQWLADMQQRHTFVPFTGPHPLQPPQP